MLNKKGILDTFIYTCDKCKYNSNKKYQWNRHLQTIKHNANNANNVKTTTKTHTCVCGKIYKHISSLCRHKKKCTYTEIAIQQDISKNTNYIENEIIKQKKMLSFLICKKASIKFYKRFNWKLLNNNNILVPDHSFSTYSMIYNSNAQIKSALKYIFYINK